MKNSIILISGASGEIGENLIDYFSNIEKRKIIAIDINEPKNQSNIFKFIKGSILNTEILNKINEEYIIEEIYHLAAVLSTTAEQNKKLAQNVNIDGTNNLFNLALSQNLKNNIITKFFFPSSIAVYNVKKNYLIPVSENKFCNPKTIYGQHKLFCENLGIAFDKYGNNQNFKIDFRSIRFPGIISINSMPSGGTSDYAPEMIHSAIKNKNYSCFVSENSRLPFIVMPDAIKAIVKIMTTPKEKLKNNIYNITSFSPSVKDFLKTIQKKLPEFKINYDIDKMREDIVNQWPNFINDKNAKNDWEWKPKYDLESAFNNYIFKNLEN